MILDIHTHIGRYGEHFSEEFVMDTTKQGGMLGQDLDQAKEIWNVDLDQYLMELDEAEIDKAVILGFDVTRVSKTKVPDEYVFDFVERHPDRLIGFAGVQPLNYRGRFNASGLKDLEKAVEEYGFKGMKLYPTYAHYAPNHRAVYPFYQKAQEYHIAAMLHLGASASSFTSLEYSRPYMLKQIGWDFPDLKFAASHMGYPWTEELLATMRMQSNIYADFSGMFGRPFIIAWDLVLAKQYGVLNRVMYGSDYPFCPSMKHGVEWIRHKLNDICSNAGWPTFTEEEILGLLGGNAEEYLK
jgi:predicted TIM-barrel fold metal-dependent hydrolase